MRRDSLAASRKAEPLLRRRLDADIRDVRLQHARNILPHGIDIRRKLRPLGNHCRVQISEPPAVRAQNVPHLFEKFHAVRAQIRVVVIRKQLSDIAQSRRTQHRVHHGMRQNVRVRVPVEALFKRNLHAA